MCKNIDGSQVRQRMIWVMRFMNLLRVEPYMFLVTFQSALKGTTILVEDKICRNWYNQSYDYCYNLPTSHETGTDPGHYKSQILAYGVQFGIYHIYISTVPSLIWALFIGSWIDRYVKARKLMMVLYIIALTLETAINICLTLDFNASVYYNIVMPLPSALLGGMLTFRVITIHYMTSMSSPKMMSIRFLIFELIDIIATPIGASLGGYLLVQKPLFGAYGEIRNNTLIYIIALASNVLALLWALFMIDEVLARKQELKIQRKILGIADSIDDEKMTIKLRSDMSDDDVDRHPLRLLFDMKNVRSIVRTCVKRRPNRVRVQLFLLILCMLFNIIAAMGPITITDAYYQLVYHWSPDTQAYMKSINMVVQFVVTLTLVPFIIKVLHVTDIPLALIGFVSFISKNILIGSWLTELAFYISIVIATMGGLVVVGIRSYLTRIVDRDEIGKVMSLLSVLDTLAPMISGTLFAYVFHKTMDSYPGIAFQMNAMLLLIPIYVVMWIDLNCKRPNDDDHAHNSVEADENKNIPSQSDQDKKKGEDFCSRL